MPTEEELEALYGEWVDSGAHLYESNHYGHERAAFYAGAAAERARINAAAMAEFDAISEADPDTAFCENRPTDG